jgi:nitrogen regulatory protein PII-like uncharacterized protein
MKNYLLGVITVLALVGCAGGYQYKYYGLSDDVDYEHGKLLDVTPAGDEPFNNCSPLDLGGGKKEYRCVVLKRTEFFKMKTELEQARTQIIDLQRQCQ